MRFGITARWATIATALFVAACSSSSNSTGAGIQAAIQDLDIDPTGLTTVIELPSAPSGSLTPGNFEANGGQIALTVSASGLKVNVTWDERVTKSDQVRAIGLSKVTDNFVSVTSSDMTVPTFTLESGLQTPGLGGDNFEVHFTGPQVVKTQVEDPNNWVLSQSGDTYSLTGSVIDYNPTTGIADVTLGTSASLHAVFNVTVSGIFSVADVAVASGLIAGAATGDTSAPSLVSAVQVLDADEYGRVIEITFDEAMDSVSGTRLSNFVADLPVFASSVLQPSSGVMQVTFTKPMIPGLDTITLQNLVDSHGNAFSGASTAITQGSSVANAFKGSPELRSVANSQNDVIVALFDQAIAPDYAIDSDFWTLNVDGNSIDLSGMPFDYDLLAKSLTINLGQDFGNGKAFDFGPTVGNLPFDIDGDVFSSNFSGTVSGDSSAPSVVLAVQNRGISEQGHIVDVSFDEDMDKLTAESLVNWGSSGSQVVLSATLMGDLRTVRVGFDALMLPGDVTLGASGIEDLAGNSMDPAALVAITSSDTIAPGILTTVATAVTGANNDTLLVVFDDDMVESEVEDVQNWAVMSPVDVQLDTSMASIDYQATDRSATLTFVGGVDLPSRLGFNVTLSTMRDIGGNAVSGTQVFGIVDGDVNYPVANAAWVDGVDDKIVHVRISEPGKEFANWFEPSLNPLALTVYELFDGVGMPAGFPISVDVSADAMQVDLTFAVSAVPGSHTLSLRGFTDLASNQIYPVNGLPILTEDPSPPTLALTLSTGTAVEGEENDHLTVTFNIDMSLWGMEDSSNYSLTLSGVAVDLSKASFSFDGARSVTINLDGGGADDLQTASSYTLSVQGLFSKWGVEMVGTSLDTVVIGGDSLVPGIGVGGVRLAASDPTASILIELSEAVRVDDASDETAIDINSVNPGFALRAGPRTTRATFGSVLVGQSVNVSMRDLAGNLGVASQLITASESTGPAIIAVSGVVQVNKGGDRVVIQFDRPVQSGMALDWRNYAVDQDGVAIDLSTAIPRYRSSGNLVQFQLADGEDLRSGATLRVIATGVLDLGGIPMIPADLVGAIGGDETAPDLASAYVNYRQDIDGYVVDVLFTEDVVPAGLTALLGWTSSGNQTPLDVAILDARSVRVSFAAPVTGGEVLNSLGVSDLAGNDSGAISVQLSQ